MVTDKNKIVMLPSSCCWPCSYPSSKAYRQSVGSGKENLAQEAASSLGLISRNRKEKEKWVSLSDAML